MPEVKDFSKPLPPEGEQSKNDSPFANLTQPDKPSDEPVTGGFKQATGHTAEPDKTEHTEDRNPFGVRGETPDGNVIINPFTLGNLPHEIDDKIPHELTPEEVAAENQHKKAVEHVNTITGNPEVQTEIEILNKLKHKHDTDSANKKRDKMERIRTVLKDKTSDSKHLDDAMVAIAAILGD